MIACMYFTCICWVQAKVYPFSPILTHSIVFITQLIQLQTRYFQFPDVVLLNAIVTVKISHNCSFAYEEFDIKLAGILLQVHRLLHYPSFQFLATDPVFLLGSPGTTFGSLSQNRVISVCRTRGRLTDRTAKTRPVLLDGVVLLLRDVSLWQFVDHYPPLKLMESHSVIMALTLVLHFKSSSKREYVQNNFQEVIYPLNYPRNLSPWQ